MSERVKNILIGLFLLTACGIIIFMILFLKPHVGDGKKIYHVRFSNISGITKGTRVTFAGRPVGLVTNIVEVKDAREGPTDGEGRVFFYELTLKVDSGVHIYASDEISIQTAGLLGEKAIAIVPKSPTKGTQPRLISHEKTIYANSQDPIENVITRVTKLSAKIEAAVSDFNSWFLQNEDNMSLAIKNFGGAMGQIDCCMQGVNQEDIVCKMSRNLDLFQDNLTLLYCTLSDVQQFCTIEKFTQAVESIQQTADSFNTDGQAFLKNMNKITTKIANGQGSLGKFINSDAFYRQMQTLLNKGQVLVNDINNYGLLFQYNKTWQRTRAKRASQVSSAKTPKQFQANFEAELDTIQVSLSRLTTLLEKAKTNKEKLLYSKSVQQDFCRLIEQIDSLSCRVKAHNKKLSYLLNEKNQKNLKKK